MIEDWIDKIQDVWATIEAPGGKSVRAPYQLQGNDFPTSINPADLERNPIVLTFPSIDTQFVYSEGGPLIGFYEGISYFHVWPNGEQSAVSSLLVWRGKIVRAAAAHMKLYNSVELFILQDAPDQIVGPIELAYGNEAWHWAYAVKWKVKEKLEGQITPAR